MPASVITFSLLPPCAASYRLRSHTADRYRTVLQPCSSSLCPSFLSASPPYGASLAQYATAGFWLHRPLSLAGQPSGLPSPAGLRRRAAKPEKRDGSARILRLQKAGKPERQHCTAPYGAQRAQGRSAVFRPRLYPCPPCTPRPFGRPGRGERGAARPLRSPVGEKGKQRKEGQPEGKRSRIPQQGSGYAGR